MNYQRTIQAQFPEKDSLSAAFQLPANTRDPDYRPKPDGRFHESPRENAATSSHHVYTCPLFASPGYQGRGCCNGESCRARHSSLPFPQNADSADMVAENFRPLQAVVRVAGVSGAHYKRVLSFEADSPTTWAMHACESRSWFEERHEDRSELQSLKWVVSFISFVKISAKLILLSTGWTVTNLETMFLQTLFSFI